MQTETRAQGKVGFLSEPIAGALAYFTFLPATVFLVLDPYKGNRFVRFHSFQCLLLWAAGILIAIALKLAAIVLFIIVIWLVLVVKALQGEFFKAPLIGEFAARTAGQP
jgi:uncharacterized membrane protein